MKNSIIYSSLFFSISLGLFAQEDTSEKSEPPAFNIFRAEEDYTYLRDTEKNPYEEDTFDVLKFIPLNEAGTAYLSFGGQFRPRFAHYTNRLWEEEEDMSFYSQRIALHTNVVFNEKFRFFGELYHGYTSHEKEIVEYDVLDYHQAFLEYRMDLKEKEEKSLSFLLGRQEMPFGAARLIGLREGPNIRRAFDAARLILKHNRTKIQTFYGKEVKPLFEVFDNEFTLFDNEVANPELWGLYSQFKIHGVFGMNEIYYLGFQSDRSHFNDVIGEERRHSVGLRRYGKMGERWYYNTEIIYQFGDLDNQDIRAYSYEADWHYKLINTHWTPNIGLKVDYTTGDDKPGDGEINTFNPMFVNPAYYSLALTITPINLISIHPSIQVEPCEDLSVYLEWAFFWRESVMDGLYKPPRFVNRKASDGSDRAIGNQFGLKVEYELDRHMTFTLDMSYFIAGEFIKESGESEDIFHIVPTMNYRF